MPREPISRDIMHFEPPYPSLLGCQRRISMPTCRLILQGPCASKIVKILLPHQYNNSICHELMRQGGTEKGIKYTLAQEPVFLVLRV